jgi:hypothetical protein
MCIACRGKAGPVEGASASVARSAVARPAEPRRGTRLFYVLGVMLAVCAEAAPVPTEFFADTRNT